MYVKLLIDILEGKSTAVQNLTTVNYTKLISAVYTSLRQDQTYKDLCTFIQRETMGKRIATCIVSCVKEHLTEMKVDFVIYVIERSTNFCRMSKLLS